MTIKRVRLNENVHEKLLYLKQKTDAKSLNDVISSLIEISEEFYITNGVLNVADKQISFKYNNGKIVKIQIRK